MKMKKRKYDILAVGELLIDFISTDFAENMDETENFKRLQGGSPANMCMNMARLGNKARLAATVGNDDMGHFLFNSVQKTGVDCHQLKRVDTPTTLILVTRSKTVANFEAYRGADKEITLDQFPENIYEETRIFHTTCFALSLEPAQSTVLQAARLAVQHGCRLSIDLNYAEKIWSDRAKAQEITKEFCSLGALIKISEVDWERLYQSPLTDYKAAAQHFLDLGAHQVCVTLGSEGCYAANAEEGHFLPARKVTVKDTTGAGDAFWSGYLTAYLDEKSILDCAKAGRRMAEIKLGTFGSLPMKVERAKIYE